MTTRPRSSRRRSILPGRDAQAPTIPTLPSPGSSGQQASKRPRRRWPIVLAITVLVAVVAGLGAAALLLRPELRVDGAAAHASNDSTPQVQLHVTHPVGLSRADVGVRVDGERVEGPGAVEVRGGELRVTLPRLRDGDHDVRVQVAKVGLLRTTLSERWTLTVDTVAPAAKVLVPVVAAADAATTAALGGAGIAGITTSPATVRVAAEADTTVRVSSSADGVEPVEAGAGRGAAARAALQIVLPEGPQALTVQVRDAAGNITTRTQKVLVDTTKPAVRAIVATVVEDVSLNVSVVAKDAHGVTLTALLDGHPIDAESIETVRSAPIAPAAPASAGGGAATAAAAASTISTASTDAGGSTLVRGVETTTATPDAAADEATPGDEDGDGDEEGAPKRLPGAATWKLSLDEPMYEGRHALEVRVRDAAGGTTTVKRAFLLDSTDDLAAAAGLRAGARGGDVAALHTALVAQGSTTLAALGAEATAKVFGPRTRAAVQRFQRARGVAADGVLGADTLAALTLKIVVNRTTKTLTLYKNGAVAKTYGVAVGSPEYPTPAGSFAIQSMQENPTWTPPDSVWAKGAKPIPPGPNNPLGTRWMAIDGTVGIHGTNNPASIGYSVSHGCIRMRIPDVEDLFAQVRIGTPVQVV